jgi:predicted Fe-S protein YdhL (DUF1289 family)
MPSPCIDVCAVEDERCVACGRTLAEIASWGTMTAAEQRAWMDDHAAAGGESLDHDGATGREKAVDREEAEAEPSADEAS